MRAFGWMAIKDDQCFIFWGQVDLVESLLMGDGSVYLY